MYGSGCDITWQTLVVDTEIAGDDGFPHTVDGLCLSLELTTLLSVTEQLQYVEVDGVHGVSAVVGGVGHAARGVGACVGVVAVDGAGDVDGLRCRALQGDHLQCAGERVSVLS